MLLTRWPGDGGGLYLALLNINSSRGFSCFDRPALESCFGQCFNVFKFKKDFYFYFIFLQNVLKLCLQLLSYVYYSLR